jgi:hypothetical protein
MYNSSNELVASERGSSAAVVLDRLAAEGIRVVTPNGVRVTSNWVASDASVHELRERGASAAAVLGRLFGAGINLEDGALVPALVYVCARGFADCALLLCQRGAAIDQADLIGETPLHAACLHGPRTARCCFTCVVPTSITPSPMEAHRCMPPACVATRTARGCCASVVLRSTKPTAMGTRHCMPPADRTTQPSCGYCANGVLLSTMLTPEGTHRYLPPATRATQTARFYCAIGVLPSTRSTAMGTRLGARRCLLLAPVAIPTSRSCCARGAQRLAALWPSLARKATPRVCACSRLQRRRKLRRTRQCLQKGTTRVL